MNAGNGRVGAGVPNCSAPIDSAQPRLVVKIDLERLRANLTQEDKRDWSPLEVRQWLLDARFRSLGGGWWQVAEPDLGQLHPREVSAMMDVPDP